MSVVAIYPGTFDPITNGHADLIERGARIRTADRQRRRQSQQATAVLPGGTGSTGTRGGIAPASRRGARFRHPAGELRQGVGANVIMRGLRAVSDFEFEFQLASMNRRLNPRSNPFS